MKDVVARHVTLALFLAQFSDWFEAWSAAVCAQDPASAHLRDAASEQMDAQTRDFAIRRIRERITKCTSIAQRETVTIDRTAARRDEAEALAQRNKDTSLVLLRKLEAAYVGPGELWEGGARHDNDFVDIARIQVAPTDEELLCSHAPFLPANIPNAPHPHPPDSMARVMDIQFRLLREELL